MTKTSLTFTYIGGAKPTASILRVQFAKLIAAKQKTARTRSHKYGNPNKADLEDVNHQPPPRHAVAVDALSACMPWYSVCLPGARRTTWARTILE